MRGGEGDLHPLAAVGPPLVPICVGEDFYSRSCPATQAWCSPMGVLRLVVARPNVFLRVIGREAAVSRWPFPATQTLPRCRTRDRLFLGGQTDSRSRLFLPPSWGAARPVGPWGCRRHYIAVCLSARPRTCRFSLSSARRRPSLEVLYLSVCGSHHCAVARRHSSRSARHRPSLFGL